MSGKLTLLILLVLLLAVWLLSVLGVFRSDDGCGLVPRDPEAQSARRRKWFAPALVSERALSGCGYALGARAVEGPCTLEVAPVREGARDLPVHADDALRIELVGRPRQKSFWTGDPPPVVPVEAELNADEGGSLPVPAEGAKLKVECAGPSRCRLRLFEPVEQ